MAEAATRTPYEQLLRTLVHRPLGLRDTSLPQGHRIPEPCLHGYDTAPPPEGVSEVIGASDSWASGGIVSTPADMTRFVRGYVGGALYDGRLVREQRRWIPGASEPAGPGAAATPDGRRSLTFSVTTQINASQNPDLLSRMRAVQENWVCALLSRCGH